MHKQRRDTLITDDLVDMVRNAPASVCANTFLRTGSCIKISTLWRKRKLLSVKCEILWEEGVDK